MRNDEPSSSDDAEVSAPRPGIGETLRATREFRRASIEYAAELLRIEPRFLAALEEERFDAIGPPVFVKGYLKHYCELLGIDPRPLLDELRQRLAGDEPPLQARRAAEREREPPRLAAIGIGAGVIALAAVAVWRFWGFAEGGPAELEIAAGGPRQGSAAEPVITAVDLSVPAAEPPRTAEEPQTGGLEPPSPAPEPGIRAVAPVAAAVEPEAGAVEPEAGSVEPEAGSVEPVVAAVEASAEATAPASLPGEAAAGAGLEIELRFVEDSWTEVTAADGERLFYGLARAGAEERIRADGEVRVLLGNADGVVVRVNGEPFAYPAGSRNGDLARFRLSPEN